MDTHRSLNTDFGNYFLGDKLHICFCTAEYAREQTQGTFDVKKLQSSRALHSSTQFVLQPSDNTHQKPAIREMSNGISSIKEEKKYYLLRNLAINHKANDMGRIRRGVFAISEK